MGRSRKKTLITEDACRYCGRGFPESVSIAADCAVPSTDDLLMLPAYEKCVTAPRFRWCARTKMLAAFLGEGAPPSELPAASTPGA